jgi:DNA-binding response OmpR family regulator
MRGKILVVDDDPDQLEMLHLYLKKAGYAIGTATNGVDAIKKALSVSPDLILLDLVLPELDGFTVCERLRQDPATASVPIIMLTALTGQIGRLAGLGAGANDYVPKPYDPIQLVAKVKELLGRRRASSNVPGKAGPKPADLHQNKGAAADR